VNPKTFFGVKISPLVENKDQYKRETVKIEKSITSLSQNIYVQWALVDAEADYEQIETQEGSIFEKSW